MTSQSGQHECVTVPEWDSSGWDVCLGNERDKPHSTELGFVQDVCWVLLFVHLLWLIPHNLGVQGIPTVFSSEHGDISLPCGSVTYPKCSSTTWLYSTYTASIEVFTLGEINMTAMKTQPQLRRLSLLSNCSLHITDIASEDAGFYTCQQYLKEGVKINEVYLTVLQGGFHSQ